MNYLHLKSTDYGKFARSIKASVSENAAAAPSSLHIYCAAFCLWTLAQAGSPLGPMTRDEFLEELKKSLHPAVVSPVSLLIEELSWNGAEFLAKKNKYDHAQATAYLLFSEALNAEGSTPTGLVRLASTLLDIQEGESVADLGCGEGFFLAELAATKTDAALSGVDIYQASVLVTHIRMLVAASLNPGSSLCNMESTELAHVKKLDMFDDDITLSKFDKIFSNYPWGIKLSELKGSSLYMSRVRRGMPEYGLPASSDWIFNRLLSDATKSGGKAVGLMTNGGIASAADQEVRRYFVENGLVEGVIGLPEKLFPHTSIPTTLIVLSQGNKSIRFVDATQLCEKGRRMNTLSDAAVEEILQAFYGEGNTPTAATATQAEVAQADYSLAPSRYLARTTLKDSHPFGSVILSIGRGASLKAADLDKLTSDEPTGIRYLKTSDLEDGRIAHPLLSLASFDKKKAARYAAENDDLLITRTGNPFKAAVAETPEGQTIVTNANVFTVKLNPALADPYYLAAFFNSATGQELLNRSAVGTAMLTLSVETLKDLPIPLPPLEEQQRVAAAYRAKLDEVHDLRKRLKAARAELTALFNVRA